MRFTDLFVKRPVLAIVVNLVILIAGLQAIRALSVRQYPRSDIAVLLTTFGLTVFADLTIAVAVGMVLASMLFMKRMSEVTNLGPLSDELADLPEVSGPRGGRRIDERGQPLAGLGEPGLSGWLLVPLLLLVIRPLATVIALLPAPLPRGERLFVAWFGIRGIGSFYSAAVALHAGLLPAGKAGVVYWNIVACVGVSITTHGLTSTPATRQLRHRRRR